MESFLFTLCCYEHGIKVFRYLQQVFISPVPYFVSQDFFIAPEAILAQGLAISLLDPCLYPQCWDYRCNSFACFSVVLEI